MAEPGSNEKVGDAGWLTQALGYVWEQVVIGDSKFNPEKTCYQLAAEYKDSGKTPEQCARNFIRWQTGKAGVAGFIWGAPGLLAMPITIPLDLASVSYLQLRMIAVIGILFGWEATSDQLRIVAFSCLLGTAAGEAVRDVGVKASTRLGIRAVKKIPGSTLKAINKFLGVHNLFIKGASSGAKATGKVAASAGVKAGSQGLVNLTKMVPLLGGAVGGGLNSLFTWQMGALAVRLLKNGPPNGGAARPNGATQENSCNDGDDIPLGEAIDLVETFVANLPEEYMVDEPPFEDHRDAKDLG